MRLLGALIAVVTLLPAWAGAQTLERVRDSGVFKIGFREDAAPYSYKNKIGQPAGYSVELCRAVATDVATEVGVAELAVDYVPVGADDRLTAVE
jgi:ABC-type amino acid transport substrate-binding protein